MKSHLRTRILATLAVVGLLLLAVTWTIQQSTLLPSFADLERQHAGSNLARATEALSNEIRHLNGFVGDWSGWDDTYKFVEDHNAEFIKSNLESDVFRIDSFDFLSFIQPDGVEVWRGGQFEEQPTMVDELPKGRWPLDHVLLSPRTAEAQKTGILRTSHGPLMLAARAVTDSKRTAPPKGWIVMGRFLHEKRLEELAQQTRLRLSILPVTALQEAGDKEALGRLRAGAEQDLFLRDDEQLVARALVPGLITDDDGLLVRVDLPRAILAQGRSALQFALWTMGVAVAVVFGVLLLLLQRIVVGPLGALTRHAVNIRVTDDLSARCNSQRTDELGTLATEIDGMVERLAASQATKVERAREGGMAEVASSVLHDVGNAMQGVHASLGVLQSKLDSRSVSDLARTSEMLAAHAAELDRWLSQDPKGQMVPPFLVALAAGLTDEHGAMKQELALLGGSLEHIQQLVSQHQQLAGKSGAIETIDVGSLFDEAVRLSRGTTSDAVVFERGATNRTPLQGDRHKLLAVLVNLVRNAREAVAAVPAARRRIRLAVEDVAGGVLITVADQGVGIDKGDLTRIFQGGFTTKQGGHGRGLHGCANSIAEMSGRLWAESEGRDRGACLRVELPAHVLVGQGVAG